MQHKTK